MSDAPIDRPPPDPSANELWYDDVSDLNGPVDWAADNIETILEAKRRDTA